MSRRGKRGRLQGRLTVQCVRFAWHGLRHIAIRGWIGHHSRLSIVDEPLSPGIFIFIFTLFMKCVPGIDFEQYHKIGERILSILLNCLDG